MDMQVKLTKRWAGYLPNSVISVSPERAEYLEKLGVGKRVNPPAPKKQAAKKASKPAGKQTAKKG